MIGAAKIEAGAAKEKNGYILLLTPKFIHKKTIPENYIIEDIENVELRVNL